MASPVTLWIQNELCIANGAVKKLSISHHTPLYLCHKHIFPPLPRSSVLNICPPIVIVYHTNRFCLLIYLSIVCFVYYTQWIWCCLLHQSEALSWLWQLHSKSWNQAVLGFQLCFLRILFWLLYVLCISIWSLETAY